VGLELGHWERLGVGLMEWVGEGERVPLTVGLEDRVEVAHTLSVGEWEEHWEGLGDRVVVGQIVGLAEVDRVEEEHLEVDRVTEGERVNDTDTECVRLTEGERETEGERDCVFDVVYVVERVKVVD
jgi:hypothetical protein